MDLSELILARFNYWIYVILMMIGLFAMITKKNLIKKLIGMSIFQTAIILFFVSVGVKRGATLPIISHHAGHDETHVEAPAHPGEESPPAEAATLDGQESPAAGAHGEAADEALGADAFANPLPHVLMLTAIVVGVATLGVGLAVAQIIFVKFRSLEEDTILKGVRDDG